MPRNLADMIDDDTMEGMAITAGQRGTEGEQIAGMYGLTRPDGPESLRDALRDAFASPPGYTISNHVDDYVLNAQAERVIAMCGIDGTHLLAVALWAGDGSTDYFEIEVDARTALSVAANAWEKHLTVTIRLGEGHLATWSLAADERDDVGMIEIAGLAIPETVLIAATGGPLEAVMTHPATDGAGLTIEKGEVVDGDTLLLCLQSPRRTEHPKGKA